jgi:hypothetical protein
MLKNLKTRRAKLVELRGRVLLFLHVLRDLLEQGDFLFGLASFLPDVEMLLARGLNCRTDVVNE